MNQWSNNYARYRDVFPIVKAWISDGELRGIHVLLSGCYVISKDVFRWSRPLIVMKSFSELFEKIE